MDAQEVFRKLGERDLLELIGSQTIYVFDADLTGEHSTGEALTAVKHWGARPGISIGFCGYSYAIPTRNSQLDPLPLDTVYLFVEIFLRFAMTWPEFTFRVTRIGASGSIHRDEEFAPMFTFAPRNCEFDPAWSRWKLTSWRRSPMKGGMRWM